MNPFFKNSNILLAKISSFSRKTVEKLIRFYKNFRVFRKIILKLWIFLDGPYKFGEIPDEFYYLVVKCTIKAQKMTEIEISLKWDESSWNYWRKSTEICRKMKDHQDLSFPCPSGREKIERSVQNFPRLDQKWREFWKFSRKFWDFWSKSLWTIDFFTSFY